MAKFHFPPVSVTPRDLRHFATIWACVFALIGFWILWKHGAFPLWTVVVIASSCILALTTPRFLQPIYRLWIHLGHALGWLNTHLIITLLFAVLIFPVGLFRRLIGKDSLSLKTKPDSQTYAVSRKGRTPDHFNWQF